MGEVAVVFDGGDVIQMGDVQDYQAVIMAAFNIHVQRERVRRGLWKDYPARDQFNQVRIKVDRILRTLEIMDSLSEETDQPLINTLGKEIESESYDIINYAVFGVRQL